MRHIPTKLHQFLISSFQDFVQTDAQTHRQTDNAENNTRLQCSWRMGNKAYFEKIFQGDFNNIPVEFCTASSFTTTNLRGPRTAQTSHKNG